MDALEERIKELRQRYALTLPGIVAKICRLMLQPNERSVPRADLLHQFHTLAGTAGTFGYEEIATLAWEAECILSSSPASEVISEEIGQLTSLLMDLDEALRRQLDGEDGSRSTGWSTFEGGGVV